MKNDNQPPLVPAGGKARTPVLNRDMVTFVGKNVDYYVLKWAKRDAAGKVKATWNGAACFGGPIWLIYRKMYWQTVVYMLAGTILSIGFSLVNAGLGSVMNYVVPVALGFAGNSLYYEKVLKEVSVLRAQFPTADELDAHLKQRGGTNPTGAWIAAIVILVLVIVISWTIFQSARGI
jgi:hypothetical protein